MAFLVLFVLLAVFLLFLAGFMADLEGPGACITYLFLGIVFMLIAMVIAIDVFPSGMPLTSINAGVHRVAFVYPAGDNVSVGVERFTGRDDPKIEHLYFYQFNKNAFEGEINTQAKKLVVVESGSFKKLRLE